MKTVKAYAKINLALDVVGKLPNGYHTIESIMQSVNICDNLTFEVNRDSSDIILTCDRKDLSVGGDNLIVKAARLMQNTYGFSEGLSIHLEKITPMQAGMGGGSSDAAATLLAINDLLDLGASVAELASLGAGLGADVPFCVYGGVCYCEGIGEKITKLSAKENYNLIVVKPSISVSTPWAYGEIDKSDSLKHPNVPQAVDALKAGDRDLLFSSLGNVFEDVILPQNPELVLIKEKLRQLGADFAQMTGSGPTIIGLWFPGHPLPDVLDYSDNFPGCEVFVTSTRA